MKTTNIIITLAFGVITFAIVISFVWTLGYFVGWLVTPDHRTVEQIQVDRFKTCIRNVSADRIFTCKNYITLEQ